MKKLLLLLTIAFVLLVALFRERIFLRDPLARVTRDGVRQSGEVVMINYTNDILLRETAARRSKLYLVQNWNKVAATPTSPLHCLGGLACMTDSDRASAAPISSGPRGGASSAAGVTMTNRRVTFTDEEVALVEVQLR